MNNQKRNFNILVILVLLTFIILSHNVYAAEWKVRDVPRKEIPCVGLNCTVLLDTVQEFGKYQVYNTFEISGNLIHTTVRIKYFDMPPLKRCRRMISVEEKNPRIFDVYVFKNDEEIAFEPYLDFVREDEKLFAKFPCYIAQSNDTITIDFYVGGKIKPVTTKFQFFNFSRSDFFYPFDKYQMTSWSALDKVYYNRIDKIILPNSFVLVKNESEDTCPSAIKFGMFSKALNKTTNETIENLLIKIYIFGDWYVFEGGGKGDFITEDNKRVIIWPTMSSGPLKDIKGINPWRYNFSENEWDNIYDGRTGCYLTATYERTEIIKYFFFISLILISISSIYFLWFSKNKEKLYKTFSSAFIIWSFQEGLSSLTPLTRPTMVTLFDLTLFVPIIFIILFYRKAIMKRIEQ